MSSSIRRTWGGVSHRGILSALAAPMVALTMLVAPAASAADPVVRAVLFYLPTCGHCEYVINDVLPVVFEESGGTPAVYYDESLAPEEVAFYLVTNGRLEILMVDTSIEVGAALFVAATEALAIESGGVPRLVVADQVLIGSVDIPEQFPGLVRGTLDAGGTIDWPEIPGLVEVVASVPGPDPIDSTTTTTANATTVVPDTTLPVVGSESPWERFGRDPVANSVAVAVLALMLLAVGGVWTWMRRTNSEATVGWGVGVLAVLGLAVAGYLAFVEVAGSEAVCGPVGNCNAVQQSDYARLFGTIPVGVAGVVGYTGGLIAWVVARIRRGRAWAVATVALFIGSVAGVLLSVYLTFLEPFVIGASCAWCLTSALVVTALMWMTARPAAAAWRVVRPAR